MSKIWPFTFNFMLFAGIACVSPFVVLYYQELGFNGTQIGLLTGITPLITFLSAPLWTGLADQTRQHRLIMSFTMLLGAAVLAVFPSLNTFWTVLVAAIFLNIFLSPISSFADSATMVMLADEKELFGRIRLGGTIGFGLAAPIAGMIVHDRGLRFAFWACAALYLLGLVVSQKLVHGHLRDDGKAKGHVRDLISDPRWFVFLTIAFVGGLSLAALNNYFYPYMKELGADEGTMGLALTIGTVAEVPVLLFVNRLLKRLRPYRLLVLTTAITGVRFLLLAASRSPNTVMLTQLLNGMTFSAMWVAGVAYADDHAPVGMRTTAQGLFSAMVLGIGMAVGGFVGGPLLESVGGRTLYLIFGVGVFAILAVVVIVQRGLATNRAASTIGM
jgi:PPP family 3-phenylpropionic acid transporter